MLGLAAVGVVQAAATLMGPITILFLGMSLVAIPEAARVLRRSPRHLPLFCMLISGGLAAVGLAWGIVLLVALPRGLGSWLLGPIWRPAYPLVLPQALFVIGTGCQRRRRRGPARSGGRAAEPSVDGSHVGYLSRLRLAGAAAGGAAGTMSGAAIAAWIGALIVLVAAARCIPGIGEDRHTTGSG